MGRANVANGLGVRFAGVGRDMWHIWSAANRISVIRSPRVARRSVQRPPAHCTDAGATLRGNDSAATSAVLRAGAAATQSGPYVRSTSDVTCGKT